MCPAGRILKKGRSPERGAALTLHDATGKLRTGLIYYFLFYLPTFKIMEAPVSPAAQPVKRQ